MSSQATWYCHECQQEMQPLMLPDPHCAHCRGTFVEQLEPDADTNPEHDPRRWAAEGAEDDEWADEGGAGGGAADNPFAQLLGLFGGGAVGGQQGPVFAAEPGAVADEDYDGENPFAEGFNAHDTHGGRPASEREGGGEPGVDHPGRPPRVRQDSDPVPFLQALFGMNPRQQQQQQQQQPQTGGTGEPQAGGSRPQVYTRTFGGGPAGGGGMFSVTFGPSAQAGPSNQGAPAQAAQDPLGEQVPVANLASFIHQAFGAPPPVQQQQQQQRRTSDPSADRPPPQHQAPQPPRPEQPLDYLMSIFSVLNGGQPLNRGNMGDFVFSERGFQDVLNQLMEQMEGRYGPRPATEAKIASLQRVKMTKEMLAAPSITDCAICKDEFAEGDECIVLPCKHLFHEADCALPWLQQNGTCPVCRYSLVEDPQDDPADAEPVAPTSPPSTSAAAAARARSPQRTRSGPPQRSDSTILSPPLEGSILPGAFPPGAFPPGAGQGREETPEVEMADGQEQGQGKSEREMRAEAAERRAAAAAQGGPPSAAEEDALDLD